MNQQRKGQRLINYILEKYPDYKPFFNTEEEIQKYLDMRARFLESRIFNMTDKEFAKAMTFGD